jgi:beta-glucuronidase
MHAPEEELAVFTEEYQALVYRKQIEMIRRQEGLVGLSPWILKDFRSPLRLYQGVQDYWNLKGLVDDEGRKKKAFAVLRDYYLELAAEG